MYINITDIIGDDVDRDGSFDMNGINVMYKYIEYIITIYGKTSNNENIVINVNNYKPYLYVKIPTTWTLSTFKSKFKKSIEKPKNGYFIDKNGINKSYSFTNNNINRNEYKIDYELIEDNYDLYNFDWNYETDSRRLSKFIKISTKSNKELYNIKRCIENIYNKQNKDPILQEWIDLSDNSECKCNLYESNINPIIRFIHMKDIKPSGWIYIDDNIIDRLKVTDKKYSSDIELLCKHQLINVVNKNSISNLIIASFDIECDSLHGSFPQATKDYMKLISDLSEEYTKWIISNHYDNINIDDKCRYNYVYNYIRSSFIDTGSDNYIETINGIPTNDSILICSKNIYLLLQYTYLFTNEDIPEVLNLPLDQKHIINKYDVINGYCSINIPNKIKEKYYNESNKILNKYLVNNDKQVILQYGDPIIQIGTVFFTLNDNKITRYIQVIKPAAKDEEICDDIPGVNVQRCFNEIDLLEKWKDLINKVNPDYITGYNIFGFDFEYIDTRVKYLLSLQSKGYLEYKQSFNFYNLGRSIRNPKKGNKVCMLDKSYTPNNDVESSYNQSKWIRMDGRIIFDMQKEIKKLHNLESYKLDYVASHFMRGVISPSRRYNPNKNKYTFINNSNTVSWILCSNTLGNLKIGDFISFKIDSIGGEVLLLNGYKFHIISIYSKYNEIRVDISSIDIYALQSELEGYQDCKIEWCLNKDDVSAKQIFNLHKNGGSNGRAIVAKYCIQDCELCIHLLNLLDIVPNNNGMSNVCYVPLSYIYLRGQGVKVMSIVSYFADRFKYRIPTLIKDNTQSGYEGAIVLEPNPPGIYLDTPITVVDYASLYPSSMIELNLSHETFITCNGDHPYIKKYNDYNIIKYDNYIYKTKGTITTKHLDEENPIITCYFKSNQVELINNKNVIRPESQGILPIVLNHLLTERKKTKKMLYNENDIDKRKVLEGLQLSYKLTANSVYGQVGAKTSHIYKQVIAACTTSIGRERINDAKEGVIQWAINNKFKELPKIVYGDTDSVFIQFPNIDKNGNKITEKSELIKHSIQCGKEAGAYVDSLLGPPQNLEYEKVFYPFILISKKRYIGDKWESIDDVDNNKYKRTSMGIVMKRRDNAPIVKYVYGNIIDKILTNIGFDKVIDWLISTLDDIMNGKFPINYFIITKSLRAYYKNPTSIAHKVLADRIGERDPGKRPKAGDRVPYVYKNLTDYDLVFDRYEQYKSGKNKGKDKKKSILQGDRIEHPDYINQLNDIDYAFYITNQIMNPVLQVLELDMNNNYESIFNKYKEDGELLYKRMDKYKHIKK